MKKTSYFILFSLCAAVLGILPARVTYVHAATGEYSPMTTGMLGLNTVPNARMDVEALSITPTYKGLHGRTVSVLRSDLERARIYDQGSAEELWHSAEFTASNTPAFKKLRRSGEPDVRFAGLSFTLDNRFSLAEEDSGALYRSSLVVGAVAPRLFGLLDYGGALRINLHDNLDRLREYRPRALLPVRGNVDEFSDRRVAVDHAYTAFTHSFKSDMHLSLIGGYLEEMYAGVGGEVLYRPFGSRLAIGAEAFQAFKRDPFETLNMGLNGDHVLSAHVNAWYDLPHHNLTLQAKVGRYLAEDFGGTLSLNKTFDNGVRLSGFISVTDAADFDLFGGTTHVDHGVRLSFPVGGFKHVPNSARMNVRAEPFGRNIGQFIENPLPLYEATDGFSYQHIAQNWNRILD